MHWKKGNWQKRQLAGSNTH